MTAINSSIRCRCSLRCRRSCVVRVCFRCDSIWLLARVARGGAFCLLNILLLRSFGTRAELVELVISLFEELLWFRLFFYHFIKAILCMSHLWRCRKANFTAGGANFTQLVPTKGTSVTHRIKCLHMHNGFHCGRRMQFNIIRLSDDDDESIQ